MKEDKVYLSFFIFGMVTDTSDLSGKIICKKSVSNIDFESIRKAIKIFKGEIFQIPPMYSALKTMVQSCINLQGKVLKLKEVLEKL
jgi:tRNA pseudouridine55 synthase